MRSFVVTRRGEGAVQDVEAPVPAEGQVVVDVALVGICGTDVGLFWADAARIDRARTEHPLRLGHEWGGRVARIGPGVAEEWLGRRVTGDTMLGCGVCDRCRRGDHHVCENRFEIGVRGGWPGALAEQLLVPVTALHRLPDAVTDAQGAMVEPGGNAWRAVAAGEVGASSRVLVAGPGTIGLLCALFAAARGAEVHVLGLDDESLRLARTLELAGSWTTDTLPPLPWDVVIDATDSAGLPQRAVDLVEPAGRVVYIGLSPTPSEIDTRDLVRHDIRVTGILGGSAGLDPAIAAYADGSVDPLPLIDRTIGLDEVGDVLGGNRRRTPGSPPKVQVDPRS